MKNKLSSFANNNLRKVKPYKITSHKAWELKDSKNILKLDWNESTITPSRSVIDSLINEIKTGRLNWYPDTNNQELIKLICEYTKCNYNEVQYFASSDALHEYIVKAFLNEKETVLIIAPTYDNFRAVTESCGAVIKYFFLDDKFQLNFDELDKVIFNVKPKIVYIVNPNNPTGITYSENDLIRLIENHNDVLFIIDEAYYEFNGVTLSKHVTNRDNIILTRTFSKAFGLASFRIGYVISHTKNIEALNLIRNPKNVSLLAQVAAISALEDIDYIKEYIDEVLVTKKYFIHKIKTNSKLSEIEIFEGGGNFVFLRFNNKVLLTKIINKFENDFIFIRDYGHIDRTINCIRITIGTKSQMKKVIKSINEI